MENNKLEYKSDIPKKSNQLKAEIVSFLNSEGGTILLGVSDKTIKRDIEKLKQENVIYREGSLTDGSWIVIKKDLK